MIIFYQIFQILILLRILQRLATLAKIIAKNKNNYYVLTANHVVGKVLKGDIIEIRTLDGEYHSAKLLEASKKIDGALLKLSSINKYYRAFIDANI